MTVNEIIMHEDFDFYFMFALWIIMFLNWLYCMSRKG